MKKNIIFLFYSVGMEVVMDERERRILSQNKEYIAQELVAFRRTDVIYELKELGVLNHDVAKALMVSMLSK